LLDSLFNRTQANGQGFAVFSVQRNHPDGLLRAAGLAEAAPAAWVWIKNDVAFAIPAAARRCLLKLKGLEGAAGNAFAAAGAVFDQVLGHITACRPDLFRGQAF
jgi:hypothetical protein